MLVQHTWRVVDGGSLTVACSTWSESSHPSWLRLGGQKPRGCPSDSGEGTQPVCCEAGIISTEEPR